MRSLRVSDCWGRLILGALLLGGGVTLGADRPMPKATAGIDVAAFPVKLSARETWLSVARPEWHLLLENPTDRPIWFELERLSSGHERFRECLGSHGFVDEPIRGTEPHYDEAVTVWGGYVPAGGWSHQAVAIWGGGLAVGCPVEFELIASGDGIERMSRKFTVAIAARPSRHEDPFVVSGNRSLEAPPDVEHRIEERRGNAIRSPALQTLLRNNGKETIDVKAVLAGFECQPGVLAWLPALDERPALAGLDTGPVRLRPGEWMVFRRVFNTSREYKPGACTARIIVRSSNLDHSASSENVAQVQF